MKKLLLLGFVFAISASTYAQQNRFAKEVKMPTKKDRAKYANEMVNASQITPVNLGPVKKNGTPTLTTVSLVPFGSSSNAFGTSAGARSALFAHPVINTVSMVYRGIASQGSGFLNYGLSIDGGTTFTSTLGPVYSPAGGPFFNARFPQSMVYNPSGNTDPANAKICYVASTLAGTNAGFGGICTGSANLLTGTSATQTEITGPSYGVADGMALNQVDNNNWTSDIFDDSTGLGNYGDSLLLLKGVWTAGDYVYTEVKVPAHVDGATAADKTTSGTNIAWGPDGLTGYVALLTHESFTDNPDSSLYPLIFKTTDAGANWTRTAALDLNPISAVLGGLPTNPMTTGFELDMSVDALGNCHIIMEVGFLASSGFSISSAPGNFGIFDLYTTNGGSSWSAQLLGTPQTFRGTFADASNTLSEDNRVQVSRTLDGSKLFFVWMDTDTASFLINTNLNPDARCVGYNVTTGLWTAETNLTAGTAAEGICIFANVSPYTLNGSVAGCYNIPMSTLVLTGGAGAVSTTVDYKYISGLEICDVAFTVTGVPTALNNFVGVRELIGNDKYAVGNNYPNPFSGETKLDINLKSRNTVSITVYNILGKVVKSINVGELNSGINTIKIDGTGLSSGMYTYTVTVGTDKLSGKMMVK